MSRPCWTARTRRRVRVKNVFGCVWHVGALLRRPPEMEMHHVHTFSQNFFVFVFVLPHVLAGWTATTSCLCGENAGHAPRRPWRCRVVGKGHLVLLRVLYGGELTTFHTPCTRAPSGCYQYGCKVVQRTQIVRERIKTMWIFPLPSF